MPEKNNVTLALALCNMVNHLQDQGAFEIVHTGYRKPYSSQTKSSTHKEDWMTRI